MKARLLMLALLAIVVGMVSGSNGVLAQPFPIWPMYCYDAQNTSYNPILVGPTNPEVKWKFCAPRGGGSLSPPVVDAMGAVYFDCNCILVKLDVALQKVAWEFDSAGPFAWCRPGDEAPGSTAIAPDGSIYFSSYISDGAYLYKLTPNGEVVWRNVWGEQGSEAPRVGPFSGLVYAIGYDGSVDALNPNNGDKMGRADLSCNAFAMAPDESIYACNNYDLTKQYYSSWKHDFEFEWDVDLRDIGMKNGGHALAIDPLNERAYVSGTRWVGGYGDTLAAITFEGEVDWVIELEGMAAPNPDSFEPYPPAIGPDGTVYITREHDIDYRGALIAVAPDGSVKWRRDYDVDGPLIIDRNGTIYFTANESGRGGDIYIGAANPADGSLDWKLKMPEATDFIVMGGSGCLYAMEEDRACLYVIGNKGP